ncbi:MAG: carbohydrate-binding protein [Bacteroidales bacterium]|nr:carbohydrate-binding protein [Bacteroidales bacterium]
MEIILQKNKKQGAGKFLALGCFLFVMNARVNSQIFIEAENYTNMLGVQTQSTTDQGGGLNVGWIDNNDWMEYELNIPMAGEYVFSVRAASLNGGGTISILSGTNSLGSVSVPSTGGWQAWGTFKSDTVTLTEGLQSLRLKAYPGGFNLNWFEIKLINPSDEKMPAEPVIFESSAGVHDISICWSPSVDTGSVVTGYKIFNGAEFLVFASDTCFSLSRLAPGKEFELRVFACDLAGNLSSPALLNISTILPNWELAWSDEFDGTEVDRSKWNFQVGGGGWGNGEAQYYTDGANSSVADGFLTIEARKENFGGNSYTSSRMNTSGKGDFLYGRVEVRAKLPRTGGTWPAIWTLPTDWAYGSWPNSGEIDIMEHTGNNYGTVLGTIHTEAYNHSIGTAKGGSITVGNVTDTFHTYVIEWYPDRIDWYVNDVYYFTFYNEYKTSAEWPFDKRQHLLLNIAIGGGLGGTIDASGVWPQQMVVDYVRFYRFTFGEGDTLEPSAPANLKAKPSGVAVDLSWEPSADNDFVQLYYIFRGDVLIDSTSSCLYKAANLEPFTQYLFSVQAKDFAGNVSAKTNIETTTTDVASFIVPGKIEAENYLYMSGIQTENCSDAGGGLNVAYIDANDWMEYSIDVNTSGKFYLAARVAGQSARGSVQLLDKDENVLSAVETPVTGGWQSWRTVVSNGFELGAGVQRIRLKAATSGFNINWFDITGDSLKYAPAGVNANEVAGACLFPNPFTGNVLSIEMPFVSDIVNISILNIEGRAVYSGRFDNSRNFITIENLNLSPGIYFVNLTGNTLLANTKLIVK